MKAISFSVVAGLFNDSPRHREYRVGRGETTGNISQIEVTANSLIYWSQNT